jgi:hypothetical protein
VDEEALQIFVLCGEKVKGARSRTVDDKYWQITAKDGEMPFTHCPLHGRIRIITI